MEPKDSGQNMEKLEKANCIASKSELTEEDALKIGEKIKEEIADQHRI